MPQAFISCRLPFLIWLMPVQHLAKHFTKLKVRIEEMVKATGQPAVILSHSYGAFTCNSITRARMTESLTVSWPRTSSARQPHKPILLTPALLC